MFEKIRTGSQMHWFYYLVQFGAVVCGVVWWRHLPVPGYAIGVLAVLAAIMSIHIEAGMHGWQKAVWMLLFGAFLIIEFRAIDQDRADFTAAEKARRHEERDQFQGIADGISTTIANSDKQFAATMFGINQNMKMVTGGDSFCYLDPASFLGSEPLRVLHQGGYPLYDVSVQVLDIHKYEESLKAQPPPTFRDAWVKAQMNHSIGNLIPGSFTEIPNQVILKGAHNLDFQITFEAINGFWQQQILLRSVNGRWVTATRVSRTNFGKPEVHQPNKVLIERIDKDFPRDKNGGVDWNDYYRR